MSDSKVVAIIQARMSSTRLPQKVLLDIAGQPMLAHVVNRTARAKTVHQVVVATTDDPADNPIEAFCRQRKYSFYRGSEYDVLDRYYQAARHFEAEIVVRITADCPVIDPGLIDKTVTAFIEEPGGCDFAANRLPPPWGRTYPVGLDTEVCSFAGLELAWSEAIEPHQREHVMPMFYEHPERFKIVHVNHPVNYGTLRWTVDTPEDLEVVRQIFAHFTTKPDFSWLDVLELYQRHPELSEKNAHVKPKDFRQYDERQKEKHK